MIVRDLLDALDGVDEECPVFVNAVKSEHGERWLELVPISVISKPHDVVEIQPSWTLEWSKL
jgi:hypothetical protein